MNHDLRLAAAIERQRMRLPFDAACAVCGETCVVALIPGSTVRCYECRAYGRGDSGWEGQHLGGRYPGAEVRPIPGNRHRLLTLLQEVYWRGIHHPGGPYAVGFDQGALRGVELAWR